MAIVIISSVTLLLGFILGFYLKMENKAKVEDQDDDAFWKGSGQTPGYADQSDIYE